MRGPGEQQEQMEKQDKSQVEVAGGVRPQRRVGAVSGGSSKCESD